MKTKHDEGTAEKIRHTASYPISLMNIQNSRFEPKRSKDMRNIRCCGIIFLDVLSRVHISQ